MFSVDVQEDAVHTEINLKNASVDFVQFYLKEFHGSNPIPSKISKGRKALRITGDPGVEVVVTGDFEVVVNADGYKEVV